MNRKTVDTKKHKRLALALAAIASFSAVLGSPTVLAQEKSFALEEIIVTARKRAESIQDVPVSVTSISTELKEANVRGLLDLQTFSPNVYLRKTPGIPGGAAISIRGVSYSETDKSFDPSVGVVVDGLYMGTASGSLLNNFDIERVEILRGPQGTLHGKNTTGGVINVIRTPVTMEWGGNINLTAGSDGRQDVKAVLNAPLGENAGIKLFGNSIQSDGHFRNLTLNEDVGGDDYTTLGFTTQWKPSDNFDLKFHYEKNKDQSGIGAPVNRNGPSDLVCVLNNPFFFGASGCESTDTQSSMDTTGAGSPSISDSTTDNYMLTANWDLGSVLLTSITAVRDMDEFYSRDYDGSAAAFLNFDFWNDWKQTSQELRLTSQNSDKFEWVAGLYYWDVDYEQRWNVGDLHYTLGRIGAVPAFLVPTPTTVTLNGQNQATKSTAAFFSGDYKFNDQWALTVGGRWTEEEKDFSGGNGAVFFDPTTQPQPEAALQEKFVGFSDKWSEFTPKVGLSYTPNDDILIFGSYSEGFKSGGFFGRQANFMGPSPQYEPEFVESLELGMKSTWMGGRLTFNPTIFKNDYKDKQEAILVPINLSNVATVVRNASNLDIKGVELELQFQATEAWNIRANYGYLDAKYEGYNADLNGDGTLTNNDNLTPVNTPENTFGLSTTYTIPMGEGELRGYLSYRYRDEINSHNLNSPLGVMDSISNVDATVTYRWAEGKYRVSAFGRNMTDEREVLWATIGGLTTRGQWNEGSTYGIEFNADF